MLPLQQARAWTALAECRGTETDLWCPGRGDTQALQLAREVCASCPVRAECLDRAMANREVFGVWGGLSERERKRIRRQRNPQREAVAMTVAEGFPAEAALSANGHREPSPTMPVQARKATGTGDPSSSPPGHSCRGCGAPLLDRAPSARWCSSTCRNRYRVRERGEATGRKGAANVSPRSRPATVLGVFDLAGLLAASVPDGVRLSVEVGDVTITASRC